MHTSSSYSERNSLNCIRSRQYIAINSTRKCHFNCLHTHFVLLYYATWNFFENIYFLSFNSGHTRQGLRCRICKVNVHADCASQLPKCQVKQKLLRRQKSTSEIENRTEVEEESKSFYVIQVLLHYN